MSSSKGVRHIPACVARNATVQHMVHISTVSIQTWAWNCAFCCSMAIIRWSSVASALSDALKLSKLSIVQCWTEQLCIPVRTLQRWGEVTFATTASEHHWCMDNMILHSQRRLLPPSFVNRRAKCDVKMVGFHKVLPRTELILAEYDSAQARLFSNE